MVASRKAPREWKDIDLNKVSNEEITALFHSIESARGADSLLDFIPRITPQMEGHTTLRPNHLRRVAEAFARAETQSVKICLSTPPRHSKSEMILHGIAWFLARHPTFPVIYSSATADFARDASKKCMDYFKRAGGKVRRGSARADSWKTEQGGSMFGTGITGQIVGRGAMLFVVDDYIKNRSEAESPAHRQKAWDLFRGSVMTRLHPGGSIIVVQTRWSPDDVIGRLERDHSDEWEIINLQCLAEENEPRRKVGEPLWPELWTNRGVDPLAALETIRKSVGDFEWSAQYQGRPRPKGTEVFGEPTYITQEGFYNEKHTRGAYTFVACDPAATTKTASDYSAIVAGYGYIDPETKTPIANIGEIIRKRLAAPDLVTELLAIAKRWNAPIAIEAQGAFAMLPDMIRRINPHAQVIPITTSKDKFTRAQPVAAAWKYGRIRLLEDQPWESQFVTEVRAFTGVGDPHDDQVDALGYFYNGLMDYLIRPTKVYRENRISQITPFG